MLEFFGSCPGGDEDDDLLRAHSRLVTAFVTAEAAFAQFDATRPPIAELYEMALSRYALLDLLAAKPSKRAEEVGAALTGARKDLEDYERLYRRWFTDQVIM
jgi:hypothetical protein